MDSLGCQLDGEQAERLNDRLPLAAADDEDNNATASNYSNQTTTRQQSQCIGRRRRKSAGSFNHSDHKNPFELSVFNFLLPFILMFLLPNIKLVDQRNQSDNTAELAHQNSHQARQSATTASLMENLLTRTTSDLLIALVRLPIDRLQIESNLMFQLVSAKELSAPLAPSKQQNADLQEEETHMMLLAPAEHRASYMSPHGGGGAPAYGADMQAGGGPDQVSGQTMPVEYVPAESVESGGGGGGVPSVSGGEAQQSGGAAGAVVASDGTRGGALQSRNDLPAVRALNVKCEKNHMTVNIVFDRPFYGMVFSKGHYNDQKCVHLPPNSGQTSVNFDIHLGKCGMTSSEPSQQQQTGLQQAQAGQQQQQPNGLFIENTIIIQYDPLVQEIYDQARKLRCTWYDYYEKSVTFRPYNVDMLDAVTANFLGDNIQCWMQIQVGKGPWSSEVAGIVKIGQTMTMVLAIKDDDNKFDMLVRNCVAHDGKHQPIQLVDEYGCVARPKIMAKFQKVRNFGSSANVVSYAHFQAFKFPDSMSVHFQCIIQVCRFECPEPVCQQSGGGGGMSELSGSGGQSGPAGGLGGPQAGGDYATSGTEMVASKELPATPPSGLFAGPSNHSLNQQQQRPPASALLTHHHHHHSNGNNVQLKLDESQGRVQVKLDTSMMAGAGRASGQVNQHTGPLPPHLLHMQPPTSVHSQQTRPAVLTGGSTSATGRQSSSLNSPAAARLMAAPQQQQQMIAPSGPGQSTNPAVQYSHPYNSMGRRSSSFASRLGELHQGDDEDHEDRQQTIGLKMTSAAAPYESELLSNPLSLLAAPRGLRFGSPVSSSPPVGFEIELDNKLLPHRFKRSSSTSGLLNSTSASSRSPRSAREDSTSVKTQKTIQVVSPDDVAFSLMTDGSDEDHDTDEFNFGQTIDYFAAKPKAGKTKQRQSQQQPRSPTVCFSTARFLAGLLVTVGALASSVVIVAFVILRQRSKLKQKISNAFECPPPPSVVVGEGPLGNCLEEHGHHFQQQAQQQHDNQKAAAIELLLARQRQRDEIQQRNNYLARLYSQFSPTTYWTSSGAR